MYVRYDDNKENSSCEDLSVYIRFQFFIGFLYDNEDDSMMTMTTVNWEKERRDRKKKSHKWKYTKSSQAICGETYVYKYWMLIEKGRLINDVMQIHHFHLILKLII